MGLLPERRARHHPPRRRRAAPQRTVVVAVGGIASADGRARLATVEQRPWSPWGREYAATPDRLIWGMQPSPLAREASEIVGCRARVLDLGLREGRDSVFLAEQRHAVDGLD